MSLPVQHQTVGHSLQELSGSLADLVSFRWREFGVGFGQQVEDCQFGFVESLPDGSLLLVRELVAEFLQAAQDLVDVVGSGVVVGDERLELLGEVDTGRVLLYGLLQPLLQLLLHPVRNGPFVLGELQGELFKINFGQVDQLLRITECADQVFLGTHRSVEQF